MLKEQTINGFRFVEQTTFYMYVEGNDKAILITSDKAEFERQIEMAKAGTIKPRAAIKKATE